MTITGLRRVIIEAIPKNLKFAIAPGIGLFIALIGLNNAGLIEVNQGPIINLIMESEILVKDDLIAKVSAAPPQIIQFGKLSDPSVLLAAAGFIILTLLMVLKVKLSMIWTIVITTIIGIPMGVTTVPESYDLSRISLSPGAIQNVAQWPEDHCLRPRQCGFSPLFSTKNDKMNCTPFTYGISNGFCQSVSNQ